MKDLKLIYDSLSKAEVQTIIHYYSQESSAKRLKLFRLLADVPYPDDAGAEISIYSKPTKTAFSHLKGRLRDDILSILLIQENSKTLGSKYRQAELECRRLLSQGDLLLRRGVYDIAIKLLNKASRLAEKYELVWEYVMIEDLKRTHLGFKKGLAEYEKNSKGIDEAVTRLAAILKARERHNQIMLPNLFRKNRSNKYLKSSEDAFYELKKLFKETKSPVVGYHYHLAGIYFYNFSRNLEKALELAMDFLDIILQEQAIRSENRIANANLQISNILLQRGSYSLAGAYAAEAVKHFHSGLMNELVALELLFFSNLRDKNLIGARDVLDGALRHPKIKASKFVRAKWTFYKSGLEFVNGQHDLSMNELNSDTTLLKDKSGWLFGYKLLEIMNFIEMKQFELIDFRVESLRKLLQRQKGENITRVKAIFNILNSFVKHGYDFKNTYSIEEQKFVALKNEQDDYHWNQMGFELVRFDDWFTTKVA